MLSLNQNNNNKITRQQCYNSSRLNSSNWQNVKNTVYLIRSTFFGNFRKFSFLTKRFLTFVFTFTRKALEVKWDLREKKKEKSVWMCVSLSLPHTFLSHSHTHTFYPCLSLSLTYTHTHTHIHTRTLTSKHSLSHTFHIHKHKKHILMLLYKWEKVGKSEIICKIKNERKKERKKERETCWCVEALETK